MNFLSGYLRAAERDGNDFGSLAAARETRNCEPGKELNHDNEFARKRRLEDGDNHNVEHAGCVAGNKYVAWLEENKIHTVNRFLSIGNKQLVGMGKHLDPYDIQCIKATVARNTMTPGFRLHELHDFYRIFVKRISTGHPKLDEILDGGLLTGEVTEITGSTSTGKTQFCLAAVATLLLDNNNVQSTYLDACNSFNPHRLEEIIADKFRERYPKNDMQDDENLPAKIEQCMSRLEVFRVFDVETLCFTISQIMEREEMRTGANSGALRLVIIDSIASIFCGSLGGTKKFSDGVQGLSSLSYAATVIRALAGHVNTAVLVTNSVVQDIAPNSVNSFAPCNWKPALGRTWAKEPDIRIHLQLLENETIHGHASVTKSSRGPLSLQPVLYEIKKSGIGVLVEPSLSVK